VQVEDSEIYAATWQSAVEDVMGGTHAILAAYKHAKPAKYWRELDGDDPYEQVKHTQPLKNPSCECRK